MHIESNDMSRVSDDTFLPIIRSNSTLKLLIPRKLEIITKKTDEHDAYSELIQALNQKVSEFKHKVNQIKSFMLNFIQDASANLINQILVEKAEIKSLILKNISLFELENRINKIPSFTYTEIRLNNFRESSELLLSVEHNSGVEKTFDQYKSEIDYLKNQIETIEHSFSYQIEQQKAKISVLQSLEKLNKDQKIQWARSQKLDISGYYDIREIKVTNDGKFAYICKN